AHGLQVQPDKRTRSVDKFKEELFIEEPEQAEPTRAAAPAAAAAPAKAQGFTQHVSQKSAPVRPAAQSEQPPKKGDNVKMVFISLGIMAVVLVIISALAIWVIKGNKKPASTVSSEVIVSSEEVSSVESAEASSVDPNTPTAEVPQLVGKRFETAQTTVGTTFKLMVKERKYSDPENGGMAEGYILEQAIAPKTMLAEGETIYVIVSQGPEYRKIPKIIGKSLADATKALEEAGLKLGKVNEVESDKVAKGKVIAIDGSYSEGESVKHNTEINISVSKGS
ncbi:MAG: PASTA domain-containing protein, partial [Oscillospiraceae bacterium]|nr:PASTA domain-containing protein [Oscillospiraceae bacterium]